MKRIAGVVVAAACSACSSGAPSASSPSAAQAQLSLAKDVQMLSIPGGNYIAGSTPEERASAYDDFQNTAGHDAARTHEWFEGEEQRHLASIDGYRIDLMPVTQAEYAEFVAANGAPAPMIDEATWKSQGFTQDYATAVARFNWVDDAPPVGHADHPVVLVTWNQASDYCAWRGRLRGEQRRLPSESEYEKAARGGDGLTYPWGNLYDPMKLNSAVKGPRDTTPVGQFVDGASPFGMLDAAGNVFQWTSSPFTNGKMTVKGSAWDDFAGLGRGAGRHGRPLASRHVIVGFRCAAPPA